MKSKKIREDRGIPMEFSTAVTTFSEMTAKSN